MACLMPAASDMPGAPASGGMAASGMCMGSAQPSAPPTPMQGALQGMCHAECQVCGCRRGIDTQGFPWAPGRLLYESWAGRQIDTLLYPAKKEAIALAYLKNEATRCQFLHCPPSACQRNIKFRVRIYFPPFILRRGTERVAVRMWLTAHDNNDC